MTTLENNYQGAFRPRCAHREHPWDYTSIILLILGLVVGGLAGAAIGYYLYRYLSETKVKSAKVQAEEIVQNAERTANQFRAQAELQTKEENVRLREEIENEAEGRRKDLRRQEERLQRRQEALDRKMEDLESRDRNMQKRQKSLEKRTADLDKLEAQHQKELERVSGLSSEEAKELLLSWFAARPDRIWHGLSARSKPKPTSRPTAESQVDRHGNPTNCFRAGRRDDDLVGGVAER